MVNITAKPILDSISSNGGENSRLITMLLRYPKFIHGEHLRHRSMSFSVSSSRAIPVRKMLEEAAGVATMASPVYWGAEQKGMQSGEHLDPSMTDMAIAGWHEAAWSAIRCAEHLQAIGLHKSIVNRVLEPFLHVNVLVSATTSGWMNFFGLRLDRAAQPEIRALAEACWKVWNDSKPQVLNPGDWHLPFVDVEYIDESWNKGLHISPDECDALMKKVSVACCAHLSFESFETGRRMTIEQCLKVHDQLFPGPGKPIHASPFEHQATPDEKHSNYGKGFGGAIQFMNSRLAGNLGPGWIQFRKTLPGEAIAPLPEGY